MFYFLFCFKPRVSFTQVLRQILNKEIQQFGRLAEDLSSLQHLDIITSSFHSQDLPSAVKNNFSHYSSFPTHFDSLLRILFLTNTPIFLNYKLLREELHLGQLKKHVGYFHIRVIFEHKSLKIKALFPQELKFSHTQYHGDSKTARLNSKLLQFWISRINILRQTGISSNGELRKKAERAFKDLANEAKIT